MKRIFLLFVGLAFCELTYGQTSYLASSVFNDSTSVASIPIIVRPGTKQINCLFRGTLDTGALDIVLKDPEGRHQAGFSLDAIGNENAGAKGGARQEFKNPFVGKWELYIKLKNASGKLSYQLDIKP